MLSWDARILAYLHSAIGNKVLIAKELKGKKALVLGVPAGMPSLVDSENPCTMIRENNYGLQRFHPVAVYRIFLDTFLQSLIYRSTLSPSMILL